MSVVMKLRLQGLYFMKMFDNLESEAVNLLIHATTACQDEITNNGNINNETESGNELNRSNDSNGDIIMAMKFLLADVKGITGHGEDSIKQLFVIESKLKNTKEKGFINLDISIKSNHLDWWIWKCKNAEINATIRHKQWRSAIVLLNELLIDINNLMKSFDIEIIPIGLIRAEILVNCRLSRILLHVGGMKSSTSFLDIATTLYNKHEILLKEDNATLCEDLFCQIELARGLVLFGFDKVYIFILYI
jgi:hypothetical protein